MITIEERKPNKLPGLSTLYISFNYNAEIVNQLKNSTTVHNYDAKTHEWEVPISDLSKLLDNLCSIDKIQLNVLKDKAEKEDKVFELSEHKTKPYPYQEDGIQYGLNHKDFLLLDQPGLGKTLQTIILSEELRQREDIQHCLIICGINTLKANWVKEIERHSKLDCMVLGQRKRKNGKIYIGGVKERLEDLKHPIKEFFVITNLETLRSPDILKALNDEKINRFDIILVDEVHKCVTEDTLIITNSGKKPISLIKEGEQVLSYNISDDCYEYKKVLNVFKNNTLLNLVDLEFITENNEIKHLKCTPDHKIFTHNRGFVAACNLCQEDIVEISDEII